MTPADDPPERPAAVPGTSERPAGGASAAPVSPTSAVPGTAAGGVVPGTPDEIDLRCEPRADALGDPAHVYYLQIRREERLNALDSHTVDGLLFALEHVARDEAARALVLEGSERSWIGGADLYELAELDAPGAVAFITRLHRLCEALRQLPAVVLAKIESHCYGAGLEVAACCDLRLASEDARFGMPEVKVGVPSVIEAARLPALVGTGRARDLVLTGRILDGREALSWSVVDYVVPARELDEEVERRILGLLESAPGALRRQKALCATWEDEPSPAAVQAGISAFGESYQTGEPRRWLRRFLDRRRD